MTLKDGTKRPCEFCGNPVAGRTVRHPVCKDANDFLNGMRRAIVEIDRKFTPEAARRLRSSLMSLANEAQWRDPEMGKNLRRKRADDT